MSSREWQMSGIVILITGGLAVFSSLERFKMQKARKVNSVAIKRSSVTLRLLVGISKSVVTSQNMVRDIEVAVDEALQFVVWQIL
jgi:hypothetical protein